MRSRPPRKENSAKLGSLLTAAVDTYTLEHVPFQHPARTRDMAQAKATRTGKQRRENGGAVGVVVSDSVTPAVRRIVIIRDGQFVRSAGRGPSLKVGAR